MKIDSQYLGWLTGNSKPVMSHVETSTKCRADVSLMGLSVVGSQKFIIIY